MVHKGRDDLKCSLSILVLYDETLGFLLAWDIADNANTQQLVFGSIFELLPLFGEVSTITKIIHLNIKVGSSVAKY